MQVLVQRSDSGAMIYDVGVLGAGLSGLSAAVLLARSGMKVALIEQSGRAGGRCYSFYDRESHDAVDNGQHLLVGAYSATLAYLESIGTDNLLVRYPGLSTRFYHPHHGKTLFRLPALPSPLDLAAGVLGYSHVSMSGRVRMLGVGTAARKWSVNPDLFPPSLSVSEWMERLGQSREALRSFWSPVAIAIMNERPERASAYLFARAITEVFQGPSHHRDILVASAGQTDLYVTGACALLADKGARVLLRNEVLTIERERVTAYVIRLKNGDSIRARSVISAVPPPSLSRIIAPCDLESLGLHRLGAFSASPIVSVHLWFDADFMPDPFIGLIDRPLHWLFNRRKFISPVDSPFPGYITGVISGAHLESGYTAARIVALALEDIKTVYPAGSGARLCRSLVIKERRATYAMRMGTHDDRPAAQTGWSGFYLAGDWTATGLPATIEGAIRSGVRAARCVLGT